jgi:protein O-mannosyl-transferase
MQRSQTAPRSRKTRNPSPPTAADRKSNDLLPLLLLFIVTLAAYLPALNGEFLWDDSGHVTKTELQSFDGLRRIWFEPGAAQQYYPLLHTAFWIEHRFWGDAVVGYHLTNVVLHGLSACLVVLIVRRLGLPGSFFAGLIFALHPVCVEAVAWISEQKSTLSGAFYLSSMLLYLRFDQTRKRADYGAALALFLCALLSKTVTATLPAALLVIFWWQRGRIAWKRDLVPLIPWFAIGAGAGLLTSWVERTYVGAKGADFALTFAQRCLIAGRAIWFYLSKLVLPVGLTFTYPHWTVETSAAWQYLFPVAFLALLAGLGILALRGRRGPLASVLLFAGTLVPALGFFDVYPFIYSYVADHFQYLASIAIIVPAAALISKIPRPALVYAGLTLLLGVLTFRQSGMYGNAATLYQKTLARNPSSWMSHNNLGNIYSQIPGRSQDAIAEYRAALQIRPRYAEAHYNLGNLLFANSPSEAIAEYQAGLTANPDSAELHANLATALSRVPGRSEEAVTEYRRALLLKPDVALVHFSLANALAGLPGRTADAVAEYREAIRLNPAYAEAHYNLGNLLLADPARLTEAIAEFEAALQNRPDFVDAHISLGSALSRLPAKLPDAIREYQTALQLNPGSVKAHYNLALALANMPGRTREALAQLDAVLQLNPQMEPARQLADRLRASR